MDEPNNTQMPGGDTPPTLGQEFLAHTNKAITIGIIAAVILGVILAVWFKYSYMKSPEESGTPTPTPTATVSSEANITVTSPQAGDFVGSPITVIGQARVFENTFSYILRDSNGNIIYQNHAMTNAPDAGIFGGYNIKIPVPVGATKNLTVEVFEYSAKDGSVINLVSVPVVLNTQATTSVKIFAGKSPAFECEKVTPLNRTIIQTNGPAYISLYELLAGLTEAEKKAGYTTAIPDDVYINSLIVRDGVAYANFDGTLQLGVAGSCRVQAIRAQITQTLLQFSTIKSVVISINDQTEGILQP